MSCFTCGKVDRANRQHVMFSQWRSRQYEPLAFTCNEYEAVSEDLAQGPLFQNLIRLPLAPIEPFTYNTYPVGEYCTILTSELASNDGRDMPQVSQFTTFKLVLASIDHRFANEENVFSDLVTHTRKDRRKQKMSGLESEEKMEHITPEHPLPEEIQKMNRDETICSYLIHNEIKALEKKMKAMEKELEHHQGCDDRENKLKQELNSLQEQRGEYEMTITVKESAIATLTNSLKSQESLCQRLRSENDDALERISKHEKSYKALKDRNNQLERALPRLKSAVHQQKAAVEEIHSFMEKRDAQMKEEIAIILSHVRNSCQMEIKEKSELQDLVRSLESRFSSTTSETEDMKIQLARQEKQILELDRLYTENKELQIKCQQLETAQAEGENKLKDLQTKCLNLTAKVEEIDSQKTELQSVCSYLTTANKEMIERNAKFDDLQIKYKNKVLSEKCSELTGMRESLRRELEESIEKCRSLQMETQQFKDQYKLKSDLRQKETDLSSAKRDLKALQIKFEEHQQLEADLSRKTSKTLNETNELKESFFKAKEEIDNLKQEREAMITSHQNRIEQLRESFKNKLAEADNWQDKLEEAIAKEKQRHAKELQALEARLKDSFVMELEIEKGKYRELMKKYQAGSQETEEKLRAQLLSIEQRYKAEISDLNDLLAENRRKSKEMEDELRREIASLKNIIRDLESRLGRLDVGNEDLVVKLKAQLRETHQELEDTSQALDKQTKAGEDFQEQIKHLQETVQKECEERFELTDALSAAKEELLLLKRPLGSRPVSEGGYQSVTPRQSTNLSLPSEEQQTPSQNTSARRTMSEPQPVISNRPLTSKPHIYNGGMKKEYTLTNNNTMVFMGDQGNGGSRAVGGSTKRTGGSLAENRRRIAAILGRK
ncbi:LEKR1-like protein [Mya arenaria]|uniref:LEKR1-like protein n=1 Tax=Mya arenaria TaxID=6604 RepID=A0ABY7F0A0_MYAAR|nr:LEKR1-like protein [Mya arenaria]